MDKLTSLNWEKRLMEIAINVGKIVLSIDASAKIYLFGSAVKGLFTALSDIDILVVTENIDKKYDIMVKVYKEVKEPIELHVTTPKLYESWYKRFIEKDEIIEITPLIQ
ncbi:MAG: nucleotidyltransferase domain-containing protein [Candidatus Methanomethylicia archaeon]